MGIAHNEKCVKYKKQIENLKLDLMESEEVVETLIKRLETQKLRYEKQIKKLLEVK